VTLERIAEKLEKGERLTFDDGVALFRERDVLAVGLLANRVREKLHGDATYFNRNMRLEVTNVCVASCLFCSFAKLEEGAPGAHTMKLEDAWRELEARLDDPPAEIHVVNGLHPGLPFSYYEELLAGFKRILPTIHLKCFTAVEIHFFAEHYGMTYADVLGRLQRAGLDSLPGGGAEIFHPEVRTRIAHDKATAEQYLDVHRTAHKMGITSRRSSIAWITCCGSVISRTKPMAYRRSFRSRSIPTATGCATCPRLPPSTRSARSRSRASCSTTCRT